MGRWGAVRPVANLIRLRKAHRGRWGRFLLRVIIAILRLVRYKFLVFRD
ncbi:MAG: hypothetical protein F6K26_30710 [Moorea sp. SIO2I5]|nr:hypothetical protein [Moorena sp. SIO2I5]